ncbi:flagellar hook-length control protein FliK [Roseivivax lentus]|uniref:flagellar hook-length control protein FliK n=1 Tax=Roseivivax lentus TaxID=633194 RepID=UPI0013566195|nr:flagellar hook-length control protein FliK [Roseivivax lentus]
MAEVLSDAEKIGFSDLYAAARSLRTNDNATDQGAADQDTGSNPDGELQASSEEVTATSPPSLDNAMPSNAVEAIRPRSHLSADPRPETVPSSGAVGDADVSLKESGFVDVTAGAIEEAQASDSGAVQDREAFLETGPNIDKQISAIENMQSSDLEKASRSEREWFEPLTAATTSASFADAGRALVTRQRQSSSAKTYAGSISQTERISVGHDSRTDPATLTSFKHDAGVLGFSGRLEPPVPNGSGQSVSTSSTLTPSLSPTAPSPQVGANPPNIQIVTDLAANAAAKTETRMAAEGLAERLVTQETQSLRAATPTLGIDSKDRAGTLTATVESSEKGRMALADGTFVGRSNERTETGDHQLPSSLYAGSNEKIAVPLNSGKASTHAANASPMAKGASPIRQAAGTDMAAKLPEPADVEVTNVGSTDTALDPSLRRNPVSATAIAAIPVSIQPARAVSHWGLGEGDSDEAKWADMSERVRSIELVGQPYALSETVQGRAVAGAAFPAGSSPVAPIFQQIMDRLRVDASGMIDLRLDPEELGRLRIAISSGETGIHVQIFGDRVETVDLLRRNAAALERAFADAGLDLESFAFGSGERSDHEAQLPAAEPEPNVPDTAAARAATPSAMPGNGSGHEGLDLRL